jgi:hypothetical protein
VTAFTDPLELDIEGDDLFAEPEPIEVPVGTTITLSNTGTLNRDHERMLRMAQVVSKFASTLTLRHIKVHLDADFNAPAPAWSDADNIWFATGKLGKLNDPKVITAIKGLSLHEICHILMTPRVGSNLGTWVRQNDLWRSFNALEDMRIETMMTTKYPSITEWMVALIAQHLLNNPKQYSVAFPIIVGRKYLPIELRNAVAQVYEDPASVSEMTSIVDQYVMLNLADPAQCNLAQPLIQRYDELVKQLQPANPTDAYDRATGWQRIQDPSGHDQRKEGELKSSSTSKPMSKGEQQDIIDRMKRQQSEQSDSEQSEGQSDRTPTPDSDASSKQAGRGDDNRQDREILDELLEDTLYNAMDRLSDDIDNTIRQFNGEAELSSNAVATPTKAESYNSDVPFEAVTASKSFGGELELLKGEYDPAWDKRQDSGKLNVLRYGVGCDVDEAFDRWELGREDAVDIECVILLDTSPSMSWTINKAYDNMWAIKRAMDKINASTTVIAFDDAARVLYSANERATYQKRVTDMGRGTEPLKALKYAKYVLAESRRAVKLIISITDGAWSQRDECDNIVRQLRKGGVLTALAYVDDTDWWNERYADYGPNYKRSRSEITIDTHGCEVAVLVNEASQLFGLAKRLVKVGIARNLATA